MKKFPFSNFLQTSPMVPNLDYSLLLKEARAIGLNTGAPKIRIALLGDTAVQQLTPLLRALFRRVNFEAEIYEGGFDGSEFETFNPVSSLFAFKPDVIVILNAVQSLRDKYYQRSGESVEFTRETMSRITRIWDSIRENCGALVIQANYAAPIERIYGNYDLKVATSLPRIVARLNSFILDEAETRPHVLLLDVEQLASWVGRKGWFDERFWTGADSIECKLHVTVGTILINLIPKLLPSPFGLNQCT